MIEKYGFRAAGSLLPSAVLAVLFLASCDDAANPGESALTVAEVAGTTSATPDMTQPNPLAHPVTNLPPNELGEIMVLEYHRLGEPESEFRRTAENFAADLRRLYDAGYRPITVKQMIQGDFDLARGSTPVVFTIDDSSAGQFYLLEDGSIDPGTMMGMWEAFRSEHPDWANGATWCILPAADHPSNFFGERPDREVPRAEREARIQRKVDLLVENGHEVCNHTLYHARLDRASGPAQVQEWIGRGEDSIRVYLPEDYDIVTLALPLGMWPAERSLAWRGIHDGRKYLYEAILEVTGGPNESPFDVRFDPHSIKRVIVAPGHLERYLAGYDRDPGRRFVSDGDPRTITVPEGAESAVAKDRWPHLEVRVVESEPSSEVGKESGVAAARAMTR